jgi:hypothetical protein
MDDLRDSVGRAFARAADAIVLLFAHAAEVASMRQAFNGSKVFAVLPIPRDAARTALAFAEALAGALAQQAAVPMLPETSPVNPKSRRTLRENRWAAGVGLAVLLLAAAPWFIPRGNKPSTPSAGTEVTVPAAPATLVKGQMDELLEGSRIAMGPDGG